MLFCSESDRRFYELYKVPGGGYILDDGCDTLNRLLNEAKVGPSFNKMGNLMCALHWKVFYITLFLRLSLQQIEQK